MSTAESFNPYGLHAVRVPLAMLAYRKVSWGAKCLYGRLALHRGRKPDGFCNPSLESLATEMGADIATIDRWLKELIAERFIERKRRRRQEAECFFLLHPCLLDSAELRNQDSGLDSAELRNQEENQDSANSRLRLRKFDDQDSANLQVPFIGIKRSDKTFIENVHSSSVVSGAAGSQTGAGNSDDDELSFSEKTEPGKPEDPDRLVSVARDQLRAARAAGADVPLEQIKSPDQDITVQILTAFSDYADFQSWIESTVSRGVARKAKSATWGLYLTDARNQAEDLRLKRESEEKREQYWQIEQERRQAAEAEQQRVMDAPDADSRSRGAGANRHTVAVEGAPGAHG